MTKSNPVVHFEMPYDDRDRMAAFYQSAFGWQMQFMGPEMGDYVLTLTTETVESLPTAPGAINGGFHPRSPEAGAPSVVISVEDIDAAMAAVTEAGGEVQGEPVDIPGIGRYVGFVDPEGNRVSLLQPAAA